ncbi:MAG: GNAT family N-acetyltransferase [Acidimicrobiales bacterium]
MLVRRVEEREYEHAGLVVVAAYAALEGARTSTGYASELADIASRARGAEVFVAVEDGSIVGCVTFVPDASSPWAELLEEDESGVRMLGVAPGAQRKGIGGALLDECVVRARALGRDALVLHSTTKMRAAHHLYEKAGFVRLYERDFEPEPGVALVAFRLVLAESGPDPSC